MVDPDVYRSEQVNKLFSTPPAANKNKLVVAHGTVLRNITGFAIEEGHVVVLDPANLTVVVARIAPGEWAALALAQ